MNKKQVQSNKQASWQERKNSQMNEGTDRQTIQTRNQFEHKQTNKLAFSSDLEGAQ